MEGRMEGALDIGIQGMSCTACAGRIEKVVSRMDGVSEASVSYPSRMAWIRYDPSVQQPEAIKERIRRLGFGASDAGDRNAHIQEMRTLRGRLMLSALLSLPLLWSMVSHYEWLAFVPVPALIGNGWFQLALATIIQFVVGLPFYINAWSALRERTANMDVLVVIGTSSAYLYSHYMVLTQGLGQSEAHTGELSLYFDTSAIVITAVLLGKYMEARSSSRALRESDSYLKLTVGEVTVVRADKVSSVPAGSVRDGDIVLVETGQRIPVDGIVTGGASQTDESLLTGESRAVPKQAGSAVWAGTLNMGETLRIRTEKAGDGTMLSRIGVMLRQAQASKTGIQRKVDAWSARFVPIMLLLSAATFLLWYAFLEPGNAGHASLRAVAVLLVACPCALGLATPISLVIASGKLARRGIVVKEAGALERLTHIDTVILDKTRHFDRGATWGQGRPPLVEQNRCGGAAPAGRGSGVGVASSLCRLHQGRGSPPRNRCSASGAVHGVAGLRSRGGLPRRTSRCRRETACRAGALGAMERHSRICRGAGARGGYGAVRLA